MLHWRGEGPAIKSLTGASEFRDLWQSALRLTDDSRALYIATKLRVRAILFQLFSGNISVPYHQLWRLSYSIALFVAVLSLWLSLPISLPAFPPSMNVPMAILCLHCYKLTLGSLTCDSSIFPGPQRSFQFWNSRFPLVWHFGSASELWNSSPLLTQPTGRVIVSPKPQLDFQTVWTVGLAPAGGADWLPSPIPRNLVVEALASLPSLCVSKADLLFRCWKNKLFLIPTLLSQWMHHTQAGSDVPSYLRSPYHVVLTWEWIGVEHMVGNSNLILWYFKKVSDKTWKQKTNKKI